MGYRLKQTKDPGVVEDKEAECREHLFHFLSSLHWILDLIEVTVAGRGMNKYKAYTVSILACRGKGRHFLVSSATWPYREATW